LVEQVLRFASVRAGRVIAEKTPVNIEQLIEDLLRSRKHVLEAAKFTVEKELQPNLPPVMADEMALRHAMQNLLDNAVKYGVNGSNWIGLSASMLSINGETAIDIRVSDRGPGIPVEEQSQIFDAFFRGRRALEDQIHGTGLGLNLVKKIIEAHGGSVRVHSEPMKGAEFIVTIPAAPQELRNECAHSLS
jgi:signal transduction histidine kinase